MESKTFSGAIWEFKVQVDMVCIGLWTVVKNFLMKLNQTKTIIIKKRSSMLTFIESRTQKASSGSSSKPLYFEKYSSRAFSIHYVN